MSERSINVVVAMDFSDDLMEMLRAVSPRLNVVRHFPEVPASAWESAEVLYTVRDFPEPEQAPNLRWIQVNYAGIDGVRGKRIVQSPEVQVTTASGVHAQTIANYCVMMMLAFHFQLPRMIADKEHKRWPEDRHRVYAPPELGTKTLGLYGYGTIARELARLAAALGMRVLAVKRDVKHPAEGSGEYTLPGTGDPAGDIPERIYPPEALAVMARECDFLVVTAPLTDTTRHSVNEQVLHEMKPTSVLINIARGALVDEHALIAALKEKRIAGAALDVFETEPLPHDSPLWDMHNVIISPHIAGNTTTYHEKAAAIFAENLRRYVEKKALLNLVDRKAGY
jgi:phosphoglycerate dehydrogenase-like enzyme